MRPLAPGDPTLIGPYRLLGILGAGGMGRVYLGRSQGGRTVAVKVVRPDLGHDNEFRLRFQREVAAARRVSGRYTAAVLDADVDAQQPWLATGFVAGLPLRDAVDSYGPLPEPALHTLAAGLARALADVHAAGLIHRDLKPSNVILAVDGPRVIDFGIARAADDSALTSTGQVIGSPGYMSPEQITGSSALGPAGDIFALGGVLIYAATGHGPFGEGDTVSMLWRVVQEQPRLDQVPATLRPLVTACLAKDPESRPTPTELLDHLGVHDELDTTNWLPGPILSEVSRRAIELLDLDTAAPAAAYPPSAPAYSSHPGTYPSGPHTPSPFPTGMTHGPTTPLTDPRPTTDPARLADTVHRDRYTPPTPPRSTRRRTILLAGGAAVVLVVGGAIAGILATQGHQHNPNPIVAQSSTAPLSSAEETTTSAASPTTTATAGAPLPSTFVGTWKGTATDVIVSFDVTVTLRPGTVGQELGTASNTGQLSHQECDDAVTLVTATPDQVTLRARLTTGGGCNDNGKTMTLQSQPDGTITFSMPGELSNLTGTLHKQ